MLSNNANIKGQGTLSKLDQIIRIIKKIKRLRTTLSAKKCLPILRLNLKFCNVALF